MTAGRVLMSAHELRALRRAVAAQARVAEVAAEVVVPDHGIVEFATSYLGLDLFPAQGTVLKLMTLDVERFTDFDREVIAGWMAGFTLEASSDPAGYIGEVGTPPDVYERIDWCLGQGRRSFREVVLVVGRRGSKTLLAAVVVAWQMWHLLALGDPQRHHRVPAGKQLTVQLVAADQTTLRRNGFADLVGLLTNAPCFQPFLGRRSDTQLSLLTPAQLAAGAQPGGGDGHLVVVAAPTTTTATRGPAVPVLWFDEFGHLAGAGSTAHSTELFAAAEPAVAQFPRDGVVLQTSTPFEMTGQFHRSYRRALAVDASGGPADPGVLMLQLPSDELYRHTDRAPHLEMWPGGPHYPDGLEPKITRQDIETRRVWNPRQVDVEYEAQFASVVDAYLLPDRVAAMFGPFRGGVLSMRTSGDTGVNYVGHADPSRSNANFAVVIGHLDPAQGDGTLPDIVLDLIHVWRPAEFPDGIINYPWVEDRLFEYLVGFHVAEFTFDQYHSTEPIQRLRQRAEKARREWRPRIYERTATAESNWRAYETLKTMIHLGKVHAPPHALAKAELEHLVVTGRKVTHPTHGDVRTDDIADACANVVATLMGNDTSVLDHLAALTVQGSQPGGFPLSPPSPAGPFGPLSAHDAGIIGKLEELDRGSRRELGAPRMGHGRNPYGPQGNPARGYKPSKRP